MEGVALARLTAELVRVAERAGREILGIYAHDFAVHEKADASPVTEADQRAEAIILEELARLAPGVPVVAEESVAQGHAPAVGDDLFFLVDPLDGTREFIGRNGEFTVNIALVERRRPIAGVVHLPVLDETYWRDGPGRAWRRRGDVTPGPIRCRAPRGSLVVVASRSHADARTDEYLAGLDVAERIAAGSSLKFCRLAEGAADLYPRIGRTMEWDIAAGHAVLEGAGGSVTTLDGAPLTYAKPGFENPSFVARGLPAGA